MSRNEAGDMATVHSPRRTRSQTTTGAAETATMTADAEILRTILQELEQLQEKRRSDQELMQTELRRLEQLELSAYLR